MALTVDTPANATQIVTIAEARAFLRLPDGSEDEALSLLIDMASTEIARHVCGLDTLARQKYVNTVPAYGDFLLKLDVMWLDTIHEVLIDGSAVTDYSVESAERGLLLRESGWPFSGSYVGFDGQALSGSEQPKIQVTVTAGLTYPDLTLPAGDGVALPAPIKRAALETVKAWWLLDQRDAQILGRNVLDSQGRSASINYSVQGGAADLALPPEAIARLKGYRRVE